MTVQVEFIYLISMEHKCMFKMATGRSSEREVIGHQVLAYSVKSPTVRCNSDRYKLFQPVFIQCQEASSNTGSRHVARPMSQAERWSVFWFKTYRNQLRFIVQ